MEDRQMDLFFTGNKLSPHTRWKAVVNTRGGVLIGTIVAMVIMGSLGAAMVSLLGSSSFQEVRANYGERAYYMAEAGFRYAVSEYRENGKSDLLDLDNSGVGTTVNVPGGGRFLLRIEETTDDNGYAETFTLSDHYETGTEIPRGGNLTVTLPSGKTLPVRGGIISVDGRSVHYLKFDSDTSTLQDLSYDDSAGAGGVLTVSGGMNVQQEPIAIIVSTGTYPSAGLSSLISVNRTVTYSWPISGSGAGPQQPPGETGELFDPGVFPGGQQPEYLTTPVAASHWHTGGNNSEVETETYEHPQGGSYQRLDLKVVGYDAVLNGAVRYNYIRFNHQPASLAMGQAWQLNNNMLSYDVQVKVAAGPRLRWASMGLMFRAQEKGAGRNKYYSGYGISLMRHTSGTTDYIPTAVKPFESTTGDLNDRVLLVLWQQTGREEWQWIAYKKLHRLVPGNHWWYGDRWDYRTTSERFDTYVRGSQYSGDGYFIHDDTSIMVRVVERTVGNQRVNDIQLFFGDARWSSDSQTTTTQYTYDTRIQDTDAYNVGQSGYGEGHHATGRFGYEQRFSAPGEDLWAWPSVPNISATNWNPQANDWFTAAAWDGVNPAATNAQILSSDGVNSVIRDSTFTTDNYAANDWNNQVKNPHFVLHTFGHTSSDYLTWNQSPIHFRDFAVRLYESPTDGTGTDFVNPIQY